MSLLAILWLASVLLAAGALAVITGLILARRRDSRRAVEREAERRSQLRQMFAADHVPRQDPEAAGDALTDLVVDLIRLVGGDERDNFIAGATHLGVARRLVEQLRAGSARTRLAAAEALGHFPDPASAAALQHALDDPSPDVRLAAALALAASDRAPPARELVERLGIGREEHSLLAVSLLREIARTDPEQVKALVLDPAMLSAVKAAAIEALSASGDYSLVPVIAELATRADAWSEELPRYLRALGDFAHPAGAAAVMHCLDSPNPAARTLAAKAAGRIGMVEAADRLVALLADPEWWVRFRAARALLALGVDGEKKLQRVAARGREPARETAAVILAERRLAA